MMRKPFNIFSRRFQYVRNGILIENDGEEKKPHQFTKFKVITL